MYTTLINYFEKQGLEEKNLANFLSCLRTRCYKSNEMILTEGEMEDYLSFIDTGIVRYFVESAGKEVTVDFAFEGSFYCAYDSFYSRKKTVMHIQALTPCTLYSISFDQLQNLYAICPIANRMGQLATEYLLSKKVKRELDLLIKTPQERYEALLKNRVKLIQHIPQIYLASYIGVVPETLSRIRKRIS